MLCPSDSNFCLLNLARYSLDPPPYSIIQKIHCHPLPQKSLRAHHIYFPSLRNYSPVLPVVQYLKIVFMYLTQIIEVLVAGG